MEINTNFNLLTTSTQKQQPAEMQMLGRTPRQQTHNDAIATADETLKTKTERSQDELEDIVDKMSETVKIMQRNLNFSIHDDTGMTVVKVMDASSGEVIRQMPTEDALRLAERLDEMRSLLFEARA